MIANPKVPCKSSDLFDIMKDYLGKNMNLARIKFVTLMILAMCKVQTVSLYRLATAFESEAESLSSMRRIQRFLSGYTLNLNLIARIIFHLLPHKGPYVLSMDRTNWQFGHFDINALVLGITYKGVAFPILFRLLPKRGNSNTKERIQIMERFVSLFGKSSIQCLVADREFVGEAWLEYLNGEQIPYHLRIRENFKVMDPRTGKTVKAWWMFNHLRLGEFEHKMRIYYVNNQLCYLSGVRLKNQEGKPELQIIVSFNKPEEATASYKERWQIETAFRAMKTSGFNIEDTHLTDIDRIERLFALMTIAFTWAYLVGIYKDANICPIRFLKHGRRAKSFFKYGLEEIAEVLSNPFKKEKFSIFKILSCT